MPMDIYHRKHLMFYKLKYIKEKFILFKENCILISNLLNNL